MAEKDINKDVEEQQAKFKSLLSNQSKRKGLSGRTPKLRNVESKNIEENDESIPVEGSASKQPNRAEAKTVDKHSKESSSGKNSKESKQKNKPSTAHLKSAATSKKTTSKTDENKATKTPLRDEIISTNISFDHMLILLKLKKKIRKAKRQKITHNDVIEEALDLIKQSYKTIFKNFEKPTHNRSEPMKVNVTEYHYDLIDDICFNVRKQFRLNIGFNDIVEQALLMLEKEY